MPRLTAGAAVLLTAAVLAAAGCGEPSRAEAESGAVVETFAEGHGPGGGPCVAELDVAGRRYGGPSKPGDSGGDLSAGALIGTGTVLCHDRFVVQASAVDGVPPELAVQVVGGHERWHGVWVRDGYCVGGGDLRSCLLGVLELDGRRYAETNLDGVSSQPIEFPGGASLGTGTIGPNGAFVAAVELAGVDPVIAVLVEGRPHSVFLALEANVTLDGTCYQTAAAYVRCLQTRAGA